ncbi:hypothetical protein Ddye_018740 [Dipteronia dyeriana]|uniref:Uncharacterized protein n=1 Tax=Dipteronia dyeriana TaxID=168575 RepID=A0AAD9UB35_9ROSI|nr:hypothetical protein Ddye_018740 [Dipteronia dyeriana]
MLLTFYKGVEINISSTHIDLLHYEHPHSGHAASSHASSSKHVVIGEDEALGVWLDGGIDIVVCEEEGTSLRFHIQPTCTGAGIHRRFFSPGRETTPRQHTRISVDRGWIICGKRKETKEIQSVPSIPSEQSQSIEIITTFPVAVHNEEASLHEIEEITGSADQEGTLQEIEETTASGDQEGITGGNRRV